MNCNKCRTNVVEIHESHDVPCYLFSGDRRRRKRQADKYGRHNLCLNCHRKYEVLLIKVLFLNLFYKDIIINDGVSLIKYMRNLSEKCSSFKIQGRAIKICEKISEDFFNGE